MEGTSHWVVWVDQDVVAGLDHWILGQGPRDVAELELLPFLSLPGKQNTCHKQVEGGLHCPLGLLNKIEVRGVPAHRVSKLNDRLELDTPVVLHEVGWMGPVDPQTG